MEIITEQGKKIQNGWLKIASENKLNLNCAGIPALSTFSLDLDNWVHYKTFITQEMLKKGWLAGSSVYVCIDHTDSVINDYLDNLNHVFSVIKKYEESGMDISELLDGPVSHGGFKRLN